MWFLEGFPQLDLLFVCNGGGRDWRGRARQRSSSAAVIMSSLVLLLILARTGCTVGGLQVNVSIFSYQQQEKDGGLGGLHVNGYIYSSL